MWRRCCAAFEPDFVLCLGFPWRLTPEALAVPRLGCVNSHPSLLPRYRGPSPIAWQVRDGEPELGMTYHRMDDDFDTGGILAQGTFPLGDDDWMPDLLPRFAELNAGSCPVVFERVARGDPGDAQDDAGASTPASSTTSTGSSTGAGRPTRSTGASAPGASCSRGAPERGRSWTAESGSCSRRASSAASREGRPGDVLRRKGEAMLVRCGEDAVWVLDFVNA